MAAKKLRPGEMWCPVCGGRGRRSKRANHGTKECERCCGEGKVHDDRKPPDTAIRPGPLRRAFEDWFLPVWRSYSPTYRPSKRNWAEGAWVAQQGRIDALEKLLTFAKTTHEKDCVCRICCPLPGETKWTTGTAGA